MVLANTTLFSFTSGELSRTMRGRADKPQYFSGTERQENFISLIQGPARYRNGMRYVTGTKSNNVAALLPFQFNDEQGYILEFTAGVIRIFLNEGILESGGSPVEVVSPYTADELFELQIAQDNDTLYIVHNNHEPRLFTRTSATSFTLSEHAFSHPPFGAENTTSTTMTPSATTGAGITITASAATFVSTDVGRYVRIDQGGDFGFARITAFTSSTSVTATVEDDFVGTGAQTTWRLGSFSDTTGFPGAVTFYEQRLVYGGTTAEPQKLFFSMAGDVNDFSTGTDADDGLQFTIASRSGNFIRWLAGMDRQMAVGTLGEVFIVRGGEGNEPITPTSITVRPTDGIGVERQIPVFHNNSVIFTERGQQILRSFQFVFEKDGFQSIDLNVQSDDITEGGLKQLAIQLGRQQIIWCAKDNGELVALTFKPSQQVFGWHRHPTRSGDKVISVATISRTNNSDQVWVVTERSVNGATQRYVEFLEDYPVFPERLEYFTDQTTQSTDEARFLNQLFEAQKNYVHVDSALTYDGTSPGTDAGASLSLAAVSGSGITFTASAAVFSSGDVGREIWKKSLTGDETGRAIITGFTSSTVVTCDILVTFDATTTIAAGAWYLTAGTVSGLTHLEAETVGVVVDGAVHPDRTVSSGSITLDVQASVVHVGVKYRGFLRSMNLEVGGVNGPAQTKFKNIYRWGIKFLETLGTTFGTRLYNQQALQFRTANSSMDNPIELFTGEQLIPFPDSWTGEKNVTVVQDLPLPCTVQLITPYSNTSN